jgi:hypothetical protein
VTLNAYLLFSADTSKGWRVIRCVTFDQGQREIDRGTCRALRDPVTCELIGFQVISRAAARVDQDIRSEGVEYSGILPEEMRAFAGLAGVSRTAALSEDQREKLIKDHEQPEDFVERTTHKVIVWPYVGPAPGDVLRVWPRPK